MGTVVRIMHPGRRLHDIFLRFQEYYESPEFRGKIFTRESFDSWYHQTRGTSYYEDWAGFNLPSYIIDDFRTGVFDPLSEDEKYLITCCKDLVSPFYIIGAPSAHDLSTLKHEMGHALYYMNTEYKTEVQAILKSSISEHHFKKLSQKLIEGGYSHEVLEDEIHAYCLTGSIGHFGKTLKLNIDWIKEQLEIVFNNYSHELQFLDFFPSDK